MEINEHAVTNKSLNEVYALLSHCHPGPIIILISRHPDPQVTEVVVSNNKYGVGYMSPMLSLK